MLLCTIFMLVALPIMGVCPISPIEAFFNLWISVFGFVLFSNLRFAFPRKKTLKWDVLFDLFVAFLILGIYTYYAGTLSVMFYIITKDIFPSYDKILLAADFKRVPLGMLFMLFAIRILSYFEEVDMNALINTFEKASRSAEYPHVKNLFKMMIKDIPEKVRSVLIDTLLGFYIIFSLLISFFSQPISIALPGPINYDSLVIPTIILLVLEVVFVYVINSELTFRILGYRRVGRLLQRAR
jgi:hypothetical protein